MKHWPYGKDNIVFRGPAGFGDTIYDVAIVKQLINTFKIIKVRTRYPTLFTWMPRVETEQWKKHGEDIAIHYAGRKCETGTNQWQDLLISARLDIGIEFKIDWPIHNAGIVSKVKNAAGDKKICIVASPHTVFGRRDGYGNELRPKWDRYDEVVKSMTDKVFFVEVGLKHEEHQIQGIGMNLVGKTSDTDTLDLAASCDFVLGQHGYSIPLSEAFKKPLFVIYSKRGIESNDPYIKNSTAKKTFTRSTSKFAIDDEPSKEIIRKAHDCFFV